MKDKDIGRRMFSRAECKEMLKKTDFRCAHCGKKLDEYTMTVEHIFPVSKGGDNSEFNTTALCEECNTDKSNFTYEVGRYYKYILPEYMVEYKKEFCSNRYYHLDRDTLLDTSQRIYEIHPIQNFEKVYAAHKRNKRAGRMLYDKLAVKLKLEKAYDADAVRIVDFLNKCKERYKSDIGAYTNDYIIRDHMRKGLVLTLKNMADEMFGVFIFVRTKYVPQIENYMQLMNFSENTGMVRSYIMTLAVTNAKAQECKGEIMTDFFISMVSKKNMPIFFNIFGFNKADTDYDYMRLPMEFCGVEGNIQFLSLKGIRRYLEDFFEDVIEYEIATKEDVEEIIESTLSSEYAFANGGFYKSNLEGVGALTKK